jgi:EAL domain-containing protein (putative c-di-GMP-specific phosphodiesterase class I)
MPQPSSPLVSLRATTPADLLRIATDVAASHDRTTAATRLVDALLLATPASTAIVSVDGALGFAGVEEDAARAAARRLRAGDDLWSSVVAQLPLFLSHGSRRDALAVLSSRGVDRAIVAGIDDGDAAGFVLVGGSDLDPAVHQSVVTAVAELAGGVLGQVASAARLVAAAEWDRTTGFLTTVGLERRIDALVAVGTRPGLVTLELDGLMPLAAGFGSAAAGAVVRDVGARVSAVPGVLAVAALSTERLAVLVAGDVVAIGDQIVARASEPVRVGRHDLLLRVHAGATSAGANGRGLLERAELARAEAATAQLPIVLHTPALAEDRHRRLELAAQLWRAIEHDELVVHYQPQVDRDGHLVALEALCRWRRADGTLVPPSAFLPVAESAGMMADLDVHVLRRACRQLATWTAAGRDGFRLAVNLSATSLAQPDIADRVLAAVAAEGADPRRIEIEITETAAAAETGWCDVLARFRAAGMTIALDDFGAGHSSLGRIHRPPLDRLKIDRAFVADLDGAGATVVRAIVALAGELGLQVLAEGVEDAATAATLVALGCDELQGYGLGRPAPADDIEARLPTT